MYYFIGIKGTGMSSLAQIMFDLGYQVLGSDLTEHFFAEDGLRERGIEILDFNEKNIKEGYKVVQGNAFKDDHAEVARARELELEIFTYQEMLTMLSKKYRTIGVAGSHGKTTVTAMFGHVFDNTVGANYLIGDGTGYAKQGNEFFIVEACEWKRHFLDYETEYAIITNIDLDHLDYYKDITDIVLAFEEYANNAEKMVIACGDDQYTRLMEVTKPIFFYGIEDNNDIQARSIEYHEDGTSFDVFIEENYYGHYDIPLYGKHSLLNSLAVIAVAYYERFDYKDVVKHLKTFKGATRRFTERKIGDIVTVGDYAHHPAEIKVTIKAARQKYPDKEVVAVVLIHTKSRAKHLEKEFIEAMNLADKSYLMDIYVDRDEPGYEEVDHKNILKGLTNGEHMTFENGAKKLMKHKDAVILFMSSKEIYVVQDEYEEMLSGKDN